MKIKATCYGVWGIPYYRTESGHTFSIKEKPNEKKVVFYYGNVLAGDTETMKMLTEEEQAELFSKVDFVQ